MKATSKRMQKRLGKGWRRIVDEQLHISSEKTEGGKEKEKEGCT